jgi:hypothetical protein
MKPDELEQSLRGAGIAFTDLDHIPDPDYVFQVLRRAKVWRFWWD